jgi:hypothetical protein
MGQQLFYPCPLVTIPIHLLRNSSERSYRLAKIITDLGSMLNISSTIFDDIMNIRIIKQKIDEKEKRQ